MVPQLASGLHLQVPCPGLLELLGHLQDLLFVELVEEPVFLLLVHVEVPLLAQKVGLLQRSIRWKHLAVHRVGVGDQVDSDVTLGAEVGEQQVSVALDGDIPVAVQDFDVVQVVEAGVRDHLHRALVALGQVGQQLVGFKLGHAIAATRNPMLEGLTGWRSDLLEARAPVEGGDGAAGVAVRASHLRQLSAVHVLDLDDRRFDLLDAHVRRSTLGVRSRHVNRSVLRLLEGCKRFRVLSKLCLQVVSSRNPPLSLDVDCFTFESVWTCLLLVQGGVVSRVLAMC